MLNNLERARWAAGAACYFSDDPSLHYDSLTKTGADAMANISETDISDLLADLMHLCDELDISFDERLSIALMHYSEEKEEEAE